MIKNSGDDFNCILNSREKDQSIGTEILARTDSTMPSRNNSTMLPSLYLDNFHIGRCSWTV